MMSRWVVHNVVFGRARVQILARRTAILTEGFRGFPQPLQANVGIVPKKLCHYRFLPNPFQFTLTCHLFIQRCTVLVNEKASLSKLQIKEYINK
jgi:hypothetical protein